MPLRFCMRKTNFSLPTGSGRSEPGLGDNSKKLFFGFVEKELSRHSRERQELFPCPTMYMNKIHIGTGDHIGSPVPMWILRYSAISHRRGVPEVVARSCLPLMFKGRCRTLHDGGD